MSWQVALVLDTETNLNVAIGEMPIWAQATPERQAYPPDQRESWHAMWYPDPGFTLITTPPAHDLEKSSATMLPTIEMHHPNLFCVHLFGVSKSDRLNAAMAEFGYYPALVNREPGLTFVRRFEEFAKDLDLDASGWNLKSDWYWMQDFYSAFFLAVGAPEWHGRNFNALNDSIAGGGINKIEVPYRIIVRNAPREHEMVKGGLAEIADLVDYMQAKGCPVAFVVADR
jgi:hypothetical protein